MSFDLIEAEKANFPKALMCRALGLSRSGHHAFETRGPSQRDLEQQKLDVTAAAIFAEEKGRIGDTSANVQCFGDFCLRTRRLRSCGFLTLTRKRAGRRRARSD
jgi:hypothetical protein